MADKALCSNGGDTLAMSDTVSEETSSIVNSQRSLSSQQTPIENILIKMSIFFRIVLIWGCQKKDPGETFHEYLSSSKHLSNCTLRKEFYLAPVDIQKLKSSTTCESFDVTLLYKVIVSACDDVAPLDTEAWNCDKNTLESNLKKLKINRNAVAHSTENIDPSDLVEIISNLKNMLTTAGEKYRVNSEEVQRELERVDVLFTGSQNASPDNIVPAEKCPPISRDLKLEGIKRKLIEEGNEESRLTLEKTCMKISIPFGENQFEDVQLKAILHPTKLCYYSRCENEVEEYTKPTFSHENLLQRWHPDQNDIVDVIIMEGDSGYGKSTFCKALAMDYHNKTSHEMLGIDAFKLLIFYEGHDQTVESQKELIKRTYHKTLSGISPGLAKEAVLEVKTLYVIDGLDQLNKLSSRIVKEIINHCKQGNATLVCTTRPHASRAFQQDLKDQGCNFRVCQFMGIEDPREQETFFLRYKEAICTDKIILLTSDGLDSFRAVQRDVFHQLMIPMNLVLLCLLQYFDFFNDHRWNNSLSLYDGCLQILRRRFLQRVRDKAIPNIDIMIDKVLDIICSDALTRIKFGNLDLDGNSYKSLKKACIECCSDFPIEELLSSLFQTRKGSNPNDQPTYQYHHQSLMEYYASRSLLQKLSEPDGMLRTILPGINQKANRARYTDVLLFCLYQLCDSDSEEPFPESRARELIRRLPNERHIGNLFLARRVLTGCKFHPVIFDLLNEKIVRGGYFTTCGDYLTFQDSLQLNRIHVREGPYLNSSRTVEFWFWDNTRSKEFQPLDAQLQGYMIFSLIIGFRFNTIVLKCCLDHGLGEWLGAHMGERNLFRISLKKPSQHSLSLLNENKLIFLEVTVLFPSPPPSSRRHLPRAQFLRLTLLRVGKGHTAWVEKMVENLAPKDGKYDSIQLFECKLENEEKDLLWAKLKTETEKLEYRQAKDGSKSKSRKRQPSAAERRRKMALVVDTQ